MNFFFDRCVGERLARMLDTYDAKNSITHQDDDTRFAQIAADVDIVREIASDTPKPVLVTADEAMQTNTPERAALSASGLTIVFLKGGWHQLDFHVQAVKLLRIWPEIVKQVSRCREPTAFQISPLARKVDRLCRTADLSGRSKSKRS